MKQKIEEILDLLLLKIEKGKSIEECLERFPEFVQELEPLLRVTTEVKALDKPEPRPEAIAATLIKVGEITTEKRQREKGFSFRKLFLFQPAVVRAMAVIILLILIGWAGLSFSAKSLPDGFLYPMKLLTEKIQYFLTVDREGKVELHLVFADKRADELMQSFQKGEKLNKELLNAMLNEAQMALKNSESLPAERSAKLLEKICQCNQNQMTVLESIKPQVLCSDTTAIIEAVNLCKERHRCIDHKLNPDAHSDQLPCPCAWDKHCDWK